MKRILLSIIGVICIYSGVFAQLILCNSNTTKTLHDVYFMNAQVGIAVGDSGIIIRSTDGGFNWTEITSLPTESFNKVEFFNQNVGLAIGTSIYRTADAGLTWQQVAHPNTEFTDLEIMPNNVCLLTGKPDRLLKSTNLGLSFITLVGDTATDNFGLLSFVNDTVGYSCAYYQGYSNHTLKTIDGGYTWTLIEDTINGYNPTVMMAMSFVSEHVGFKAGWYNPHLQKTTDGANQWSNCTSPDSLFDPQLNDLHAEANMQGHYFACGWYGFSYASKDYGNTWTILDSGTFTTQKLNGIYFLDGARGWIVGSGGTVLKYETTIGLQEDKAKPIITVYPNPSNGRVTIEAAGKQNIESMAVFSLTGILLQQINGPVQEVDLSKLSSGVYVFVITAGNEQYVKRWTKL